MRKLLKFSTILIFIIALALIIGFFALPEIERKFVYKIEYSDIVERCANETGLDKYFIYAVIKTESNFNENATSNVGARGLMQLMPDAFDWVKYRMGDKRDITYDGMFNAENNIEYGTHMLMLLKQKYGSEELALAAYHGGMTTVDNWLKDGTISKDGKTVEEIPSKATAFYVEKVLKAWQSYKNLYDN